MPTTTTSTTGRRRRRLLPAAPLWVAVLWLALLDRSAAVRATGDRGEQNSVSVVVWTVAALALGLLATGIIAAWSDGQLAVFGGTP